MDKLNWGSMRGILRKLAGRLVGTYRWVWGLNGKWLVRRLVVVTLEGTAVFRARWTHCKLIGRWVGRIVGRLGGRWIHMDRFYRRLIKGMLWRLVGRLVDACRWLGGLNGRWLG